MSTHVQLYADEVKASVANDYMVALHAPDTTIFLADVKDKAVGVGDLIARMFEALASAPDLTDEERTAVRDRMMEAQVRIQPVYSRDNEPVPYTLPPPADATARELTYWQRIEAEADSIADPVICGTRIVVTETVSLADAESGYCLLERGHGGPCSNVREWRVGA